jgi:hypothetical protein
MQLPAGNSNHFVARRQLVITLNECGYHWDHTQYEIVSRSFMLSSPGGKNSEMAPHRRDQHKRGVAPWPRETGPQFRRHRQTRQSD